MKVLEEDVVEAHRNMLDGLEQWRQQDVVLLSMTNAVDYDQVLLSIWVFTILLANFNTVIRRPTHSCWRRW